MRSEEEVEEFFMGDDGGKDRKVKCEDGRVSGSKRGRVGGGGGVLKRARCCGGWCLCPEGGCECDQGLYLRDGGCCWRKEDVEGLGFSFEGGGEEGVGKVGGCCKGKGGEEVGKGGGCCAGKSSEDDGKGGGCCGSKRNDEGEGVVVKDVDVEVGVKDEEAKEKNEEKLEKRGEFKMLPVSLADALPPLESHGYPELTPEDYLTEAHPLPQSQPFSSDVLSISPMDLGLDIDDEGDKEDAQVGLVVPLYNSGCCGGMCRCGPKECACDPNAYPPGSCCWGVRTEGIVGGGLEKGDGGGGGGSCCGGEKKRGNGDAALVADAKEVQDVTFGVEDLLHGSGTENKSISDLANQEVEKTTKPTPSVNHSVNEEEHAVLAEAVARAKKTETYCNACEKECWSGRGLSQHLKTFHSGERVYPCEICEKSFVFKQNRDRHLSEVHLSRRLFPCPEKGCDASFKNNGGLKHHKKTVHRRERPFRCEECGKGFGQRNHMTQHIATVHERIKPFVCEECGHRFSNKGNLNQHLRRRHTKKEQKAGGGGDLVVEKGLISESIGLKGGIG